MLLGGLIGSSPEYRIHGFCDGILYAPPGQVGEGSPPGFWALEFKTTASSEFDVIHSANTPKEEHVRQAQIYLWLTGYKWSLILYFEKGAYGMGALTEHLVERDEERILALQAFEPLQKGALRGGRTGQRPPRHVAEAVDADGPVVLRTGLADELRELLRAVLPVQAEGRHGENCTDAR